MTSRSFKDIVAEDIKNVFINPLEFADSHVVNGVAMNIVVDDMENIEREKKMKSTMDGLYARQVFIYVAAEDFGDLPAQNRVVVLDGKSYRVIDATEESGVYGITLEANKSR